MRDDLDEADRGPGPTGEVHRRRDGASPPSTEAVAGPFGGGPLNTAWVYIVAVDELERIRRALRRRRVPLPRRSHSQWRVVLPMDTVWVAVRTDDGIRVANQSP